VVNINYDFNLLRFFKSPQECHFLVTNIENFVTTSDPEDITVGRLDQDLTVPGYELSVLNLEFSTFNFKLKIVRVILCFPDIFQQQMQQWPHLQRQ
jgi:hypothetical protein